MPSGLAAEDNDDKEDKTLPAPQTVSVVINAGAAEWAVDRLHDVLVLCHTLV